MPAIKFDSEQLADVCRRFGLKMIILFGSRAKGIPPPTPESDLDVAILGGDANSLECFRALAEVFPEYTLDVVSLSEADPLFRHEVMSAGVLLIGDPGIFCEYKAYAYRDFVDSADLRALEAVLFKKKMAYIHRQLHAAS